MSGYQRIRNVSYSESFTNVINEISLERVSSDALMIFVAKIEDILLHSHF